MAKYFIAALYISSITIFAFLFAVRAAKKLYAPGVWRDERRHLSRVDEFPKFRRYGFTKHDLAASWGFSVVLTELSAGFRAASMAGAMQAPSLVLFIQVAVILLAVFYFLFWSGRRPLPRERRMGALGKEGLVFFGPIVGGIGGANILAIVFENLAIVLA